MIAIAVSYATPEKQLEIPLRVDENCTVESAIIQSKILEHFQEINLLKNSVGIFSKPVTLDTVLHDGDRVEIYRPLITDPKEARRLKVSKQ